MPLPPTIEVTPESPPTQTFDTRAELEAFMRDFQGDAAEKKRAEDQAKGWTADQLKDVRGELERRKKNANNTAPETSAIENAAKRLAEIAEAKMGVREQLKELAGVVQDAPSYVEKKASKIQETLNTYSSTIKAIGGSAIIVGAFLLLRKLWKGTKEKATQGKEAVKRGFGWLWRMLGIGAVGLAGYFGVKSVTDKISKQFGALQDKADQAKEWGEKAIAVTAERERQLAEDLQRLDALKAAGTAAVPAVVEAAKEGQERALVIGPAKILVSLFGDENLQLRPQVMEDVLTAIKTKNMTMKQVFDAKSPLTLTSLGLPPNNTSAEDKVLYEQALRIVVENCQKNQQRMKLVYEKREPKKNIDDVLCFNYIREAGGGGALLHLVFKKLKDSGDVGSLDVGELMSAAKEELEPLTRGIMAQFAGEKLAGDKNKILREKAEKMTYFSFLTKDSNVGTVAAMRGKTNPTDDEKIMQAIFASMPTADNLLPYFCQIFPDAYFDQTNNGNNDRNRAVINEYLAQMTTDQGLRIFFAHKMLASGNPLGAMWLQCEILSFINKRQVNMEVFGFKIPLKNRAKRAAIRIAQSVAEGSFTQALIEGKKISKEEAEYYGKQMQKAISFAVQSAGLAFLLPALPVVESGIALGQEYPVAAGATGVVSGGLAINTLAGLHDKFIHSRRDMMGATKVFEKFMDTRWVNKIRSAAMLRYSPSTYEPIHHVFSELRKHANDKGKVKSLDTLFRNYIKNQGSQNALNEFFESAKRIAKLGPDTDLCKRIDALLTNDKALAALAKHFRPLRYYAGTYGLPILGILEAAAVDMPEMFAAWEEAETLRANGEQAAIQQAYGDLHATKAIVHGAGLPAYLIYARWAAKSLGRASVVGAVATEAAFYMTDAALASLEDFEKHLDASLSEDAKRSSNELKMQMRSNEIGRAELNNTADTTRTLFKKSFSAYLLQRLYAKAKAGDADARFILEMVAHPKKEDEGVQGSDNARWEWYVQFAWRTILRNNPNAQTSAELIDNMADSLEKADLAAKVDLDARAYISLKRNLETQTQRSFALEKELIELREAIKMYEEKKEIAVLTPFAAKYSLDEKSPDLLTNIKEVRDGLIAEGLQLQSALSMTAKCLDGMTSKAYIQDRDGRPPLTLANILEPPEYADEEAETRQAALMNFRDEKKLERDAELLKLGEKRCVP